MLCFYIMLWDGHGGMTLPMGKITKDYLINHRLTPYQYAPNLFRVLCCVDAFNE